MCSTPPTYNKLMMTPFQISHTLCHLNLILMRNLRWKRSWIQICTEDTLCGWLNGLTLMNLPDINFLISLSVMRLWSTSTIITWINQARLTGVNNLLIKRTQSFYHESFLTNSHIHSNRMTLYIISACYSAGKLRACVHDPKTHQHVFQTSTRFSEPWQGFSNLNKVFWTSTRFSEPWQDFWNLNKVFKNLDEVDVALMRQYSRFIENRMNSRGRVMSQCDHVTCAQITD